MKKALLFAITLVAASSAMALETIELECRESQNYRRIQGTIVDRDHRGYVLEMFGERMQAVERDHNLDFTLRGEPSAAQVSMAIVFDRKVGEEYKMVTKFNDFNKLVCRVTEIRKAR